MLTEEYIAKRVKELCAKHGFSKYRLAQLTGMTQTALGKITSGSSLPTILTLDKICEAFGISLAQFFAEGERPDLTDSQRELLNLWDELDVQDQKLAITIIRSIKEKKG